MRVAACVYFALSILFAFPANAAPSTPSPAITFHEKGVTVSNLTVGGSAALFMMSRQPDVFITRLHQRSAWLTAGVDGTAQYVGDDAVAPQSVWAVVDLESGRYGIACPSGDCGPLQRPIETTTFFKNNAAGEPEGLDIPMEVADVYLISPKTGVWHAMLGDGGKGDEDGLVDGKARIAVEKFTGFNSKNPPPQKLNRGDVLLLFQPMNLHFAVIEVAK